MGVTFSYFTTDECSDAVRDAVLAEADSINISREWSMTEGILFFPAEGYEGKLFGDSKLKFEGLAAYDPESGQEHDGRVILDALQKWSKEHGLAWTVTSEENEHGHVRDGDADEGVLKFLSALEEPEIWDM